jgi:iron complex transport system substrate-binding protein
VKYGGALVGGGLLAGCAGQSTEGAATGTENGTTTNATTGTDAESANRTGANAAYTASIVPAGEVRFEGVPESWLVYNGGWADMAFALGRREGFLTAGNMIPGFFFEPFGLDVPPESELPPLYQNGGWVKEVFYELDPDVALMDPEFMHGTGWDDSWAASDTERLQREVAPFFGNNCRRRREFHDYKLYSLYGAFERLAAAFQERERYRAFASLHEEVQSEIDSRTPDDRPTIGLINGGSKPGEGTFYPLDPRSEGYEMKPYRDLNVASSFPDAVEGEQIGYEKLLETDPEIIVVHWGIGTTGDTDGFSAEAFDSQYVRPMEEDPIGSQLTAVQEGRVYPGQYGEQGPIVNLLQTEMVAQQLYPDEFGAFDPGAFPSVSPENRLFDRDRVTAIVEGEL